MASPAKASLSSRRITADMKTRILESRKLGSYREDVGEWTAEEWRQLNMSRGLIRRDIIHKTMYQYQVSKGRPHADWSMCGNDDCNKGKYVEKGMHVLRRSTFVAPGDPFSHLMPDALVVEVAPRFDIFVRHIVRDQFQIVPGSSLYENVCSQVRSFGNSPPVRNALYTFRMNLLRAGLDPSRRALAVLLSELRGACIYMVKLKKWCGARNFPWMKDKHECFRPAGDPRPKKWGLRQFVVEFCTVLEAWRRFAQRHVEGTDWRFMQPSVAGDFYLCLLLNEWCMLKNGQLYNENYTRIHLLKVWDEWFQDHTPIDQAELERDTMALREVRKRRKQKKPGVKIKEEDGNNDADDDGGRVLTGVGQLTPSWQSARLHAFRQRGDPSVTEMT